MFYPSSGERITRGLEYVAISRPTALADLFLMSGLSVRHFSAGRTTPLSYQFITNFYNAMRNRAHNTTSMTAMEAEQSSASSKSRGLRMRRNHSAGGEMDTCIFPFSKLTVVI